MDTKQLESRSVLLKMANVRKGIAEPDQARTNTGFSNNTITSFRKKMMEEEKASEMKDMNNSSMNKHKTGAAFRNLGANNPQNDGVENAISYDLLPVPEMADRSHSIGNFTIEPQFKEEL